MYTKSGKALEEVEEAFDVKSLEATLSSILQRLQCAKGIPCKPPKTLETLKAAINRQTTDYGDDLKIVPP